MNACKKSTSVLDFVTKIKEKKLDETTLKLTTSFYESLKASGAKSFKEIEQEYKSNSDYFKQLEYMKVDGTSEKSMPGLGKTIIKK